MKKMLSYANVRQIVLTLFLSLFITAAYAVPARPGQTRNLTLSDGTTISAVLVGDEHGHYWLGQDGKAYQDLNGDSFFQTVNAETIQQKARQRRVAANRQRMRSRAALPGDEHSSYVGQKKGLIILVNFSDKQFKSSNDNAFFQRIANEENFNEGSFKGSMYDYFLKQSGGQFELTFDIVGPVTVSQTASYYGKNDAQAH